MPYQPVDIEFVDNNTGVWVDLGLERLDPREVTAWPFAGMANRFKSSSPACELFIHQPLAMLLETRDTTVNTEEKALMTRVLAGIDLDSRVSTFIVNHEESLSGYHLQASVYSGEGSGRQLAIVMWKFPPTTDEEGSVVRAARAALLQHA